MSRWWRWALPAYPLLAVNALIALLYAVIWCRAHSWSWRDGVLTFVARRQMIGAPGGQGWSWIVGYADEDHRDSASLRVHENVHVAQEFAFALVALGLGAMIVGGMGWPWWLVPVIGACGGPAFALAYGIGFALHYRGGDWRTAYRANIFERYAYAIQARFDADEIDHVAWGER